MKPRSLKKSVLMERLPLALSFALPFGIACVAFLILGLYPLGDHQILAHDGWHQYYPFFRAFREKLLSGGSLQYTWDVGMGTGYLSLFAYYLASPLNLLTLLVPSAYLRELFSFLTILKLAFAGLFFGYFLKTVYRENDLAIPFFSLLYAFCAWASGYYWNLMWLDTFALLPLLIAGMVALLRDGRFRLYVCALALSLWCNYYIAFFCCIFVFLCFFGFCIVCRNGWKEFFRRFVRIGVCTLIGAGLSAVLLFPTLLAMQTTYSATAKEVNLLALNIAEGATGATAQGFWHTFTEQTLPGVFSAMRQILVNLMPPPTVTKMSGLPNIFCGFSCAILGFYYLCCPKIPLREKLFNVFLLCFLLLSFIFRILDYVWHGFHFPNMLPYRFSFLFSFVLVAMAYRAYQNIDRFRLWHLCILAPCSALLILNLIGASDLKIYVWIASAVVFAAMIVFFVLYGTKILRKAQAAVLLCTLLLAEAILGFSSGVSVVGSTTRSIYPKEAVNVNALLEYMQSQEPDTLFWRTEVTDTQTLNDGALNGYHGVSIFTSSANVNFNRFSRSLGLSSWPGSNRYLYYESSPFTNLMTGVKYLIDRGGQHQNRDYNSSVAGAGNVKLLKNNAYLSLGFMADAELGSFVAEAAKYNPIREQEEMFRMATGVEEPLYTHLAHSALEAPDDCSLRASGTSGTQFSYSTMDADGDSELSISYTLPSDGLYCATSKPNNADEVKVYCNGEYLFTRNLKARSLFSLGNFQRGDVLRFAYKVEKGKDSTISLDVALHNNAAFDAGFAALADEPWELTEFSDTRVSGVVTAKQDGLFYSSIPYEPGWTATVDGAPVPLAEGYDPQSDAVALTDAVIAFPLSAGTHTITLRYEARGLRAGAVVSAVSLLLFVAMLVLLRKKRAFLPPEQPYAPPAAEPAPEPVAEPVPEPGLPEPPEEIPGTEDML